MLLAIDSNTKNTHMNMMGMCVGTAVKTSFIANISNRRVDPCQLLKNEAIDRLASIVYDLPNYKKNLETLIANFTVDDVVGLINSIYRDTEFKSSIYYQRYSEYFDEIEDLIHTYLSLEKN